ncbi:potassium/proton antiporter [Algoriphagus halophytocola]|uniref:Potassium/proton antiporter n=1 Tax=Algoriphagus halophytocola TaxID=2991499 RepID=A0ABY6MJQ0_9BACT|nr:MULTISPECIES: potassium/proton antiporter [unclassified Algoriphagus]UZD22906.1 potassium/proton antiporter [Algoriphagus sp. TR-M5]WBL44174.1 potassium/proton antiporter [Algoriphagus sp. TR-M9]
MTLTAENILLISSLLLLAGVLASKTAGKTGIPMLLIFLGVGMLAGSDGIGGIRFDNPYIAQFLGIIALTYILYSGGLDTKWPSIKPVLKPGITLSTLGVLLTSVTLGTFVYLITGLGFQESLLLGAIVSSTDAAAVFSVLRAKSIGLKGHLRPLLELESGSNDPMAYFLTVSLLGLITLETGSLWEIIPLFFIQMLVGGLLGWLFGRATVLLTNKVNLDFEGLYPVMLLALVLITYTFVDLLGGNGFLAVYISAITVGNGKMAHKKSLMKFFDGVAWLMQVIMFITLGLLVFPKQLIPISGIAILAALFLIFVARPLGVFISLSFFKFKLREKAFISWVGLRGAVPIVFATLPLIADIEQSAMIFHIVFFIVLASVAIQATTLPLAAKLLHLSLPASLKKRSMLDIELSEDFKNAILEVQIPQASPVQGKKILELGFPSTCLIVLVKRGGKFITPNGQTELEAEDELMIMMENDQEEEQIKALLHI